MKIDSGKRTLLIIIPIAIGLVSIGLIFSMAPRNSPPAENSNGSVGGDGDNSTRSIIGNPTDIGAAVGMRSILLTGPEEKISFRFTAKNSGDVQAIAFSLLTGNYSSLRGGLQEDEGGNPGGEWLGLPGVGKGPVDVNEFMEIRLEQPAPISRGKVYHLVIQAVDPVIDNGMRVKVYHLNSQVQPLNDDNYDVPWPDPMMSTLYYDGKAWVEENHWPIFVVKYSDGRSEGQPYSLAAPWVIAGARYVGQQFVASSNYIVDKFGFSVSVDGKADDDLYYEVRDSNNKVMEKGLFAKADQLGLQRKFVEVKLDSPLTLKKDELYRFVLLTPGTQLTEPYHVYGHEFTYDSKIGYGALRHILTISYDGGTTWHRWEDADTIFSLSTR